MAAESTTGTASITDRAAPARARGGAPAPPRWAGPEPLSRRQLLFGPAARPSPHGAAGPPRLHLRWVAAAIVLLFAAWLIATTPFARALQPVARPSLLVLAADGTPIARRGPIVDDPVLAAGLPPHVALAFISAEDRRFVTHAGVDPRGLARAALRNIAAGGVREGGSTITQQLARLSALDSDRTALRKLREVLLAFWLELRLSKEEILSRYLSSAYFGDNVYGLRAAARHYFNRPPEGLSVAQAAMLAGLVNAPSRLSPTRNLEGARARGRRVMEAMARDGHLDRAIAAATPDAVLDIGPMREVPGSTWFVDWVMAGEPEQPAARTIVRTTLDPRLQRLAERAVASARLGGTQAALVAMRPDGRVVAMVGGRDYRESPFNRAVQARRQPGSAFKLFVYLAAIRRGLSPDALIADVPIAVGDWEPSNYEDDYRGVMTLREAFARSSNSAAVQLSEWAGRERVIAAARELGVTGELVSAPSLALGTSSLTLLEMTAAYAGVVGNRFPVRPHGRADPAPPRGALALEARERAAMLDLLWSAANHGTGRAAALRTATFGKTGTSQSNRDAWFIGFAGELVVGVWIGNDDNRPLRGVSGGGLPASIWRGFMAQALGERAAPAWHRAAAPVRAMTTARGPRGYRSERRGRGKAKGRRWRDDG